MSDDADRGPDGGIRVREATTDDVQAVVDVARDSWYAAYGGLLDPATIEQALGESYDPELVEVAIEHEEIAFYVAEADTEAGTGEGDDHGSDNGVDGDVVGYASAEQTWADEVELHTIYVHPNRWGEGVGTALLERVKEWAREQDVDRIALGVLQENAIGIGFFEGKGFSKGMEGDEEIAGELHPEFEFEQEL